MRGKLTAYDGPCFLLVEPTGDMPPGRELGLYYEDTRFLSLQSLRLDGKEPVFLSAFPDPASVLTHYLTSPALSDIPHGTLLIRRSHAISRGMHVDIDITSYASSPIRFELCLEYDADFADVFEIKRWAELAETRKPTPPLVTALGASVLGLAPAEGGWRRRTEIRFSKRPRLEGARAHFEVTLEPGQIFSLCQDVYTIAASDFVPPRRTCASLLVENLDEPDSRSEAPRQVPRLSTDFTPFDRGFARAVEDLYTLRMRHLEGSDEVFYLAAGAPWFMALFGRDSLIAAMQTLAFLPDLARGVLLSLARLQGRVEDPEVEQEPGKILHEYRPPHLLGTRGFVPRFPYYGSVDSTPLFICLLSEVFLRTGDIEFLRKLEPNLISALGWIERKMREHPSGFITYRRSTSYGLLNQGWKDSEDSIRFRNGDTAEAPIALIEVQGYAVDALRRATRLYRVLGRSEIYAKDLEAKADSLAEAIEREFFLEDRAFYALAIDGRGRKVDALSSNPAHLLWSGIAGKDRAGKVAKSLLERELFSGFGLRTMGSLEAAFNPVSYHNGSVWPHDTSLAIAGLARYGLRSEAAELASGLLAALAHYPDHRLPELFSGLSRDEAARPVEYATANSPQAWAAGAVLLMAKVAAGLTIDVPSRRIELQPALPRQLGRIALSGIEIDGAMVDIELRREGGAVVGEVHGAPQGYAVVLPSS